MKNNIKGFTLLELIIVIVVMGLIFESAKNLPSNNRNDLDQIPAKYSIGEEVLINNQLTGYIINIHQGKHKIKYDVMVDNEDIQTYSEDIISTY